MSYIKHWRKISAAAASFALESSSDEYDGIEGEHIQGTSQVSTESEYDESEKEMTSRNEESDSENSEFSYPIYASSSEQSDLEFVEPEKETLPSFKRELTAWITENHIRRAGADRLLDILRKRGHDLPKDSRTLLQTPNEVPTEARCGGSFAYFGIKASLINFLNGKDNLDLSKDIDLLVNIDGIPLFKSSGTQFWPILCKFQKFEPFLVGLFYGERKPNSVDDFLRDFLIEYNDIRENGMVFKNNKIKIKIKAFICDAPARAFLKCVKGHSGYDACERCTETGTRCERRIIFRGTFPQRTDDDFSRGLYCPGHQNGVSPLQDSSINCVQEFCLDYMHLVCLGVTKRILYFFKKGPNECRLSQQQITNISTMLVGLSGKLPSEFARQPRTLDEMERWKATEFRQFLLYTGPVVLRKVLNDSTYKHFLCLTVAISILLDSNDAKRQEYLEYAKQLLNHFVEKCENIFCRYFTVYNVHCLKHLPDDVHNMKCSLNEISSFPFENHLQSIKRLVRNSKNPIGQVVKRLAERDFVKQQHRHYSAVSFLSCNKRNGCILLKNENFAFVIEKREHRRMLCDVIHQNHVDSFFTEPCNSKLLNIGYLKNLQTTRKKRRLVEFDEVSRKVVCLPYKSGYVLLPLLHGMEKSTC